MASAAISVSMLILLSSSVIRGKDPIQDRSSSVKTFWETFLSAATSQAAAASSASAATSSPPPNGHKKPRTKIIHVPMPYLVPPMVPMPPPPFHFVTNYPPNGPNYQFANYQPYHANYHPSHASAAASYLHPQHHPPPHPTHYAQRPMHHPPPAFLPIKFNNDQQIHIPVKFNNDQQIHIPVIIHEIPQPIPVPVPVSVPQPSISYQLKLENERENNDVNGEHSSNQMMAANPSESIPSDNMSGSVDFGNDISGSQALSIINTNFDESPPILSTEAIWI